MQTACVAKPARHTHPAHARPEAPQEPTQGAGASAPRLPGARGASVTLLSTVPTFWGLKQAALIFLRKMIFLYAAQWDLLSFPMQALFPSW